MHIRKFILFDQKIITHTTYLFKIYLRLAKKKFILDSIVAELIYRNANILATTTTSLSDIITFSIRIK